MPILRPAARAYLKSFTRPRANYFAFDASLPIPTCGPSFFGAKEDFLEDRKALMALLWTYNERTQEEVSAFKQKFDSTTKSTYLSMCIRRGDKFTEYPYVKLEKYAEALDRIGAKSGQIFVATDDYETIKKLHQILP